MQYRFVVEDEVMDAFIQASALQRERLLKLFQQLANEAPKAEHLDHRDSVGRPIYRQDFAGWSIWFWHDVPFNDVRIVEVEKRRR